jgi:hypothetical protein
MMVIASMLNRCKTAPSPLSLHLTRTPSHFWNPVVSNLSFNAWTVKHLAPLNPLWMNLKLISIWRRPTSITAMSPNARLHTLKTHFIVGVCSTNRNFQINLWYKLLPQSLITLNLLRRSRINPQLSAQTHINGAFGYNCIPPTPLAQPGTKVFIHEKPTIRDTCMPHAVEGWYLGPEL